jgi:hypothetical protein
VHLWWIVILAALGALVGSHLAGPGVRTTRAALGGAVIGVVVGFLLPVALGVLGAILHLAFTLALIALAVAAGLWAWRLVRH